MIPLVLFALAACSPKAEPPAAPPEAEPPVHATVDFDDPSACAACHDAVVTEWGKSMHARSHDDNDPIYASMRAMRIEKQGEAMGAKCLGCHTPRDPGNPDSPAGKLGVSCATCHAATAVDLTKGKGAKALTFSEDTLVGPHDIAEGASTVHGTGPAADHLVDGQTICLACHDATQTPDGAAACTTGPEHSTLEGAGTCTSCHMPRVAGASGAASTRSDHASHEFVGPHHAWNHDDPSLLASAVDLQLVLADGTATLTVENKAGHAFPTGFPGRMLVLGLTELDGKGMKTHTEQIVWNKVYVDATGKKVPAAFASELKTDTRLEPGEKRVVAWQTKENTATVEAKLQMRLLPPPLAEKLKLQDAKEAEPRTVAVTQAAL